MIPPTLSKADSDEFNREFLEFLASFKKPETRTRSVRKSIVAALIAAAIGLTIGVLVAVGQSWAIGLQPAYRTYGVWWLAAPALGIGVLAFFFLILLCGAIVTNVGAKRFNEKLSERAQERIERIFFPAFLIGMIGFLLALPIKFGFEMARENNPILASSDASDISAIETISTQQSASASGLVSSARKLLVDLSETEREIEAVRGRLQETIGDLTVQDRLAADAKAQTSNLVQRQKQIALRTAEVERILGGQAVITRSDLERSGWTGLALGTALGFFASLAASFVFEVMARRRRRSSLPKS